MQLNLKPLGHDRLDKPRQSDSWRVALDVVHKWRAKKLSQQVGVAFLAVAVALFVRLYWLDALGMRLAYVTLFPAATVAAVLGGYVGGLLALSLGALAASVWLAPLQEPADWLGLFAFVGGSLLVLVITEAMHLAHERAVASEIDAQMSRALRESEARLRLFVEQAPVAIALFDNNFNVVAASHRWIVDYGSLSSGLEASAIERWRPTLRRVLAGETVINDSELLPRANGHKSWQRWEAKPWKDVDGLVSGVTVFAEDITARVEAESALRDSQARLKAIVDSAVDAIITADQNGTITSVNPATPRLFGYQESELIGQDLSLLMPEPDKSAHSSYLNSHSISGQSKVLGKQRSLQAQRKDGSTFPIELAVTQAKSREGALFIGMLRDITQRVQSEESLREAQKLEAVGQLTGGIAHDFNNLLTVIICNLELLEMRIEDETKRRLVLKALDAADMGHRLTDRLLAFARRQPLLPEVLDVNLIVLSLKEMLQRAMGATITLTTSLVDQTWPILADRGQLEGAIVNLALNSRDAMPSGGQVCIETKNLFIEEGWTEGGIRLPSGRYLQVCVSDTGTGMTPEVKERAFEPFYTTKPVGRGTGLGLATVYGFVRQSHGAVAVESELSGGTKIRLFLPAHTGAIPRDVATQKRSEEDQPTLKGLSVLVVEDEASLREVVSTHLRSLGARVMAAENGSEALSILSESEKIDLVVTDLVMPGHVSGLAVAECVRERYRNTRLLMMSGFADEFANPDRLKVLSAPLLRKPFRLSALVEAIEHLIADHKHAN
ncbi:MAG: PAS domain S-box protein [Hyphomicrobiaceae bacterium]|nr:PAS domain S-box protein [Hyphomicrobiaceae bacterium]